MASKDTVNNIYPQFEVDRESNQYLKLKFIILEKDWPYPNFEMYIQHNDPMMFIRKELQERHGDIQSVKLYLDSDKQNEQFAMIIIDCHIISVKRQEKPQILRELISQIKLHKFWYIMISRMLLPLLFNYFDINMNQHILKTYLVYGDSGAGKSSFIKNMKGINSQELLPQTGGKGNACTSDPGQIYYVKNDDIFGDVQFIDTRGTWDPSKVDNQQILDDLVSVLLAFSVQGMKKNLDPIQIIDGVIYIHTSLSYDRYARNARIAHLSSLIGQNLDQSTMTLMTHCASIVKLERENEKFAEMLKTQHQDCNQYVLWDSEEPLQNQKLRLKEILNNLKPFHLKNLEEQNQKILQLAKELQMKDLVETQVTKYETVKINRTVSKMIEDWSEKEITLWMECPKSYAKSLLTKFTYKFDNLYARQYEQNYSIEPFPERAMGPKMIQEFKIIKMELQNAEMIEQPTFLNKGDYYEVKIKYKWKALQDSQSAGSINLKLSAKIKYKMEFVLEIPEVQEIKTLEMLPRYSDEKPYLQLAQEQQLESIFTQLRKQLD